MNKLMPDRKVSVITSITAGCALLAMTALPACNVALVDDEYHGEPMLVLSGQVQIVPNKVQGGAGGDKRGGDKPRGDKGGGAGSKPPKTPPGTGTVKLPDGQLRLALVWEVTSLSEGMQTTMSAFEQSMVLTSSFPARYQVVLFTPPNDRLIHTSEGQGKYALGTIVAYADADNDGAFDPQVDSLIGGAPGRALIYTPGELSAVWLKESLTAGYHRVRVKGDKATCDQYGHVSLVPDTREETELKVYESFDKEVLLDLDCDGKRDEWRGACPPPHHLKEMCKKSADHAPCQYCKY